MGFKCYLCKCLPDKVKKITLHRFPNPQKYPVIHSQWLAACGLNEKDDVTKIRVCSSHFRDQDKLTDYHLTKVRVEAIPSINVKNPTVALQAQIEIKKEVDPTPHPVPSPEPQPQNETSSDLVPTVEQLSQNSEKVILEILSNMDDLDKHFEHLYSCMTKKQTCTVMTFPIKAGCAPMENISETTHDVPEYIAVDSSALEKTVDTTEEAEETWWKIEPPEKKRRNFHPRYVSEIEISDVSTPRRASLTIKFVKDIDQKKSKKIRNLQSVNRRLQERVTELEDLLSEIGGEQMNTEDAENTS